MRGCARRRSSAASQAINFAECESIAGTPLTEVFEYASTTKNVDYAKYFALAGFDVRFIARDERGNQPIEIEVVLGRKYCAEIRHPAAAESERSR
jgi:hypothetical protein